jgi:hypothetical protein
MQSILKDFIGFSYNWNNKLSCRAFTTIRLHNPSKYILNERYYIRLKSNEIGTGQIVAINDFLLKNLTTTVAYIDTGYCKEECTKIINKMYSNVDFNVQKLSLITIVMDKKDQ